MPSPAPGRLARARILGHIAVDFSGTLVVELERVAESRVGRAYVRVVDGGVMDHPFERDPESLQHDSLPTEAQTPRDRRARRSAARNPLISAYGARPVKPAKLPSDFRVCAARTKPAHAARASAPP